MKDPAVIWTVFATLFVFAGHVIRAIRWSLMFPVHEIPRGVNAIIALSIGYAVNAFVPFRIGEIFRIFFLSHREKVAVERCLSTVIVERLLDLVVVSVIGSIFLIYTGYIADDSINAIIQRSLVGLALAASLIFVYNCSAFMQSIPWKFASLFNQNIKLSILSTLANSTDLFYCGIIWRREFVIATTVMWGIYIASYYCLSRAINSNILEVFIILLGDPIGAGLWDMLSWEKLLNRWPILIFLLLPVAITFLYAFGSGGKSIFHFLRSKQLFSQNVLLRGDRFRAPEAYPLYLAARFGCGDAAIAKFGECGVGTSVVHRFYSGGSGAVTVLIEDSGFFKIRKFATGEAAAKLSVQAQWLKKHCGGPLPLVQVLSTTKGSGHFIYDMPLTLAANDFCQVIHGSDTEYVGSVFSGIMDSVDALHASSIKGEATDDEVDMYLEEKVVKNARYISKYFMYLTSADEWMINGTLYSKQDWELLFDLRWLRRQITNKTICSVHGDLTIENIIIAPTISGGWFAIDPNPDNIFDSPLLDWAKLMQSLHMGYESLNRVPIFEAQADHLVVPQLRTDAYSRMHLQLQSRIVEKIGDEGLTEVYFHEVIHYLRLTPYKIKQDPKKGLVFFGCTMILLNKYLDRCGRGQG